MTKILEQADVTAKRLPIPVAAGRHHGIDALRFVLCFAVALLHTMPRGDVGVPPLWVVITGSVCRGAVPFFFITSRFFVRVPDRLDWKFLSRPVIRIFPVYAVWMAIYFAIDVHDTGKVPHIGFRELLTGGTALHLWFLPALAVAMIAVPVLLINAGRTATWLICLALAGVNLAFVAYRDILHLPEIPGTRAMIAPLLFLVGMEIARKAPIPKLSVAIFAVAVVWIITISEEFAISYLSKSPLVSHSSVATTYIFGSAIFLLAQALPGLRFIRFFSSLGIISLGIYASHLIFVRIFANLIGGATLATALAAAAAAIVSATILCLALNRSPLTRRFVR